MKYYNHKPLQWQSSCDHTFFFAAPSSTLPQVSTIKDQPLSINHQASTIKHQPFSNKQTAGAVIRYSPLQPLGERETRQRFLGIAAAWGDVDVDYGATVGGERILKHERELAVPAAERTCE
jgi:hypothetical protein